VKQQVISRTDYDPFAAARDMPVTRGRVTLPVGMRRSRGSNLQGIGNGEQGTGKRDLKLSKPPEPSKPSQPISLPTGFCGRARGAMRNKGIDCNDMSRSKRRFPSYEGMKGEGTTINTTQ
jgi:hypothetical protein